jgi:hypothetical protein
VSRRYASDHESTNPSLVSLLRAVRLREHIDQSEEITRWRKEKFIVRMTERAWNLLLGWLQGGGLRTGDEDEDDSGRDRVLRIINERVQISGELSSSFGSRMMKQAHSSPCSPSQIVTFWRAHIQRIGTRVRFRWTRL